MPGLLHQRYLPHEILFYVVICRIHDLLDGDVDSEVFSFVDGTKRSLAETNPFTVKNERRGLAHWYDKSLGGFAFRNFAPAYFLEVSPILPHQEGGDFDEWDGFERWPRKGTESKSRKRGWLRNPIFAISSLHFPFDSPPSSTIEWRVEQSSSL